MFNIRTIFLQVLRRGEEVEEEWDEAEDEEITSWLVKQSVFLRVLIKVSAAPKSAILLCSRGQCF